MLLLCNTCQQHFLSSLSSRQPQVGSLALSESVSRLEPENERMRGIERYNGRICRGLGAERVDEIVGAVKEKEAAERRYRGRRIREHVR